MQLEDQVVSLELAKKLQELGFKQESYFAYLIFSDFREVALWCRDNLANSEMNYHLFGKDYEKVSAFTVAELGEMLPDIDSTTSKVGKTWVVGRMGYGRANTEADARAKMLIYLKENNLL